MHLRQFFFNSFKKKFKSVLNEVDEPTIHSKSERERQISYFNAHIWDLGRWYQQSYMQGSKGNTDINKRL